MQNCYNKTAVHYPSRTIPKILYRHLWTHGLRDLVQNCSGWLCSAFYICNIEASQTKKYRQIRIHFQCFRCTEQAFKPDFRTSLWTLANYFPQYYTTHSHIQYKSWTNINTHHHFKYITKLSSIKLCRSNTKGIQHTVDIEVCNLKPKLKKSHFRQSSSW